MLHYFKLISAIVTWSIALTAIVTDPDPRGIDAAVFVATIACVPTFWLMVDHAAARVSRNVTRIVLAERKRTEDLVLDVATEFARSEVRHLRVKTHV